MHDSDPSDLVVDVRSLRRRFGQKIALDDVDLTISRGVVHGLVGANGAGKTTLIKHILGLLRPDAGRVRVFGRDPVADPQGVLGRIGYVSEEHDLPGWMKLCELMKYYQAFFPNWDPGYADSLRRRFELDLDAKVKSLSKGQRARAELLVALAHRPEFLVLDEPSAGLDPLVRRDILEAIVRAIAEEGRTVLFSSHLLDEVERVADHVTMIRDGSIVLSDPLEDIKADHRGVTFQFSEPRVAPPEIDGALKWEGSHDEWRAIYCGSDFEVRSAAMRIGARIVAERTLTLDEIFVARVGAARRASTDRMEE